MSHQQSTAPSTSLCVPSSGRGSDAVQGGHHLVAWSKVTMPSELGGLGVMDLTTLGYVRRLHWEWLVCTKAQRLWAPLLMAENIVKAMCL
jgi:hypothetical protein